MKKWIFSYLQLDKNVESHSYRKRVTSKFILLLSFSIIITLMIGNFISNNFELFYINIGLLISMILMLSLPGRQRKFASYIILHVMALGILLVVYFHQGREYTPIWYFLYIFLVMPLYGHRTGFKIASCFLAILLVLMFTCVGSSISVMEFVRFTMVACFTLSEHSPASCHMRIGTVVLTYSASRYLRVGVSAASISFIFQWFSTTFLH